MLFSWKIGFGGIPSSRNVLFLQIFLKRSGEAKRWKPCPDLSLHQRFPKHSPRPALQPSPDPVELDLGLHQGFLEPFQEISPEPCCTCPGSAPKNLLRNLLRKHVEPNLALQQSFPHLLRNVLRKLLRKPVEADRALHQSLPDLLRNLFRNPVEPDLGLHQSLPGRLRNRTRLCTHASWNLLRNLLRNPVEPDLPLHQSFPGLLQEPSPEPCWNWPAAPKPPTFSRTFSGTVELDVPLHQSSRNFSWNFLRNPVELDLALHQSLPHLLRNLLRNPVELDLALHQSLPDLHRNLLRTLLSLT